MTESTTAPAERTRAARFVDTSSERSLESLALLVGAAAFVLGVLAALIAFRLEPAPISGAGSIGQFAAIASAVVALLAFAAGRLLLHERVRGERLRALDYVDIAGVFPVNVFFGIHTAVASGMVVAYGVLVVGLPRWVTGMPRPFVLLGWLFLGVTLLLAVFFAVGYYNLTAVELVGGVLIFTWIILFIRNAAALQQDAAR